MKPASIYSLAAVALAAASGIAYQIQTPVQDQGVDQHAPFRKAQRVAADDLTIIPENRRPASNRQERDASGDLRDSSPISRSFAAKSDAATQRNHPNHILTESTPHDSLGSHSLPTSKDSPELDDGQKGTSQSSATARTLQLATNFQLPVALMAPTSSAAPQPDDIKTPVEKATQAIVDDFYRDLSDLSAANPEETTTSNHPSSEAEEMAGPASTDDNIIVEPDSQTDSIRRHADELYRSLFGDEAYGRKGMESTLEVRLPEASNETSD